MEQFLPHTLSPGAKCVFIGAMNLGKTRLVQHLLLTTRFRRIHVQTTDEHAAYGVLLENSSVEDEYNEAALKRHLDANDCDAIILDDCLYDPTYVETDTFRRLMTQKSATVFVTMLFAMTLTEPIRRLFDYVFIFRETGTYAQERLFALYCSPAPFSTREALAAALHEITEYPDDVREGACLVIMHNRVMRYYVPKKYRPLIQDNVTTRRSAPSESEASEIRHDQD